MHNISFSRELCARIVSKLLRDWIILQNGTIIIPSMIGKLKFNPSLNLVLYRNREKERKEESTTVHKVSFWKRDDASKSHVSAAKLQSKCWFFFFFIKAKMLQSNMTQRGCRYRNACIKRVWGARRWMDRRNKSRASRTGRAMYRKIANIRKLTWKYRPQITSAIPDLIACHGRDRSRYRSNRINVSPTKCILEY